MSQHRTTNLFFRLCLHSQNTLKRLISSNLGFKITHVPTIPQGKEDPSMDATQLCLHGQAYGDRRASFSTELPSDGGSTTKFITNPLSFTPTKSRTSV